MLLVMLAWIILPICWKWTRHWFLFIWKVSCVLFVFATSFPVRSCPGILNDCVCCDIDNQIDENGVRDVAEALKVNSTLVEIDLHREWNMSCVCFSSTAHLFVSRYFNKQGCCQLHYRRIESERVLDFHLVSNLQKLHVLLNIISPHWSENYIDGDDYDTIDSLCQRNRQLRKRVIHSRIVDIVIAISSLLLPPYVILEIVDKFEHWSLVNRKFKIDTIIAVDKSCKRVRSLRK